MSKSNKKDAVKKMADLLNKDAHCGCGCSSCVKKAAISTLGAIGSNFKKLTPSAVNANDISAKPMRQKQLGQQQNNPYLNNYSSQTPINTGSM